MCGTLVITACSHCSSPIRGRAIYHDDEGDYLTSEQLDPASYCYSCGSPYPWTQQNLDALDETLELLIELDDEKKREVRQAVRDVLVESPRSAPAVLRIKKIAKGMEALGRQIMVEFITKIAAESLKSQLRL